MKTFKRYHKAFKFVYLPILAVLSIIAALYPAFMHNLFYVNGLFVVLLILLFLSPLKTYHTKNHPVSIASYCMTFIKLTLLQIILLFIAININLVFSTLVPANHGQMLSVNLSQDMIHFFKWGFFPWSAMLLVGIVLAVYRVSMREDITIRQLTYPIIGKQKDKFLDVGIELFLRQGLIICASIIVMVLGLSLYFYAVALGVPKITFKPSGYTLIMYFLIFITISSRFWKGQVKRFWKRQYTTLQLFLIQTILSIAAILLLTPALTWFGHAVKVDMSQSFLFPMPHLTEAYAWMLLNWSFWLAMVVALAPMVANIARNKNIRIIIIMGLFWPVMFTLAWFTPKFHELLLQLISIMQHPEISLAFNILMLIGAGFYFGFNKSFETLLMRYFYQEKAAQQKRYPLKMLNNLLRLMTFFLLLYIFAGINLLPLLLFAMVATCYPIYIASGLGLLKNLWLHR